MTRALTELAAILAFFTLLLVVAPKQASEGHRPDFHISQRN